MDTNLVMGITTRSLSATDRSVLEFTAALYPNLVDLNTMNRIEDNCQTLWGEGEYNICFATIDEASWTRGCYVAVKKDYGSWLGELLIKTPTCWTYPQAIVALDGLLTERVERMQSEEEERKAKEADKAKEAKEEEIESLMESLMARFEDGISLPADEQA